LVLPGSYQTGDEIDGAGVFAGSFASLEIDAQSFALSLPGDQLINVEFATTMAAVPLPAGGALLLTELGALGFARSRRRAS
jgi:hypothetical protein